MAVIDAQPFTDILFRLREYLGFSLDRFFIKHPEFKPVRNSIKRNWQDYMDVLTSVRVREFMQYLYQFIYDLNRRGLDHREKYEEFIDFFNISDYQANKCFGTDHQQADVDGGLIYLEKKLKELIECFPR